MVRGRGAAEGRSDQRDGARTTGSALEAHYRFVVWLVPTLERFPRSQKFLLGDRIQGTSMDVLEQLIEATYTRQRERHLANANLGLEKLRFLCRLAHTNSDVTAQVSRRRPASPTSAATTAAPAS